MPTALWWPKMAILTGTSQFFVLMQCAYATSAYHEARFLVHFHLAIRANFERGVRLDTNCQLKGMKMYIL